MKKDKKKTDNETTRSRAEVNIDLSKKGPVSRQRKCYAIFQVSSI